MSRNRLYPILTIVAALLTPLAAGAQTTASPAPMTSAAPMTMGHGHHHRRHRESLMHALQALDLTDAQKQQVATFHGQEKQANMNADPATRHANGAKMRSQIMGILTPDQKSQLQAEMRKGKPPVDSMMAPRPAPSPNS